MTTHQKEQLVEVLDAAESADVTIEVPAAQATIRPLAPDAEDLLRAAVEYAGELEFQVNGVERRNILLRVDDIGVEGEKPVVPRQWDIGLHPRVSTDFYLRVKSGHLLAELTDMEVHGVDFEVYSGSMEVELPGSEFGLHMDISVDSGRLVVNAPRKTALGMADVEVRSGELELSCGPGSTYEADVVIGSGRMQLRLAAGTRVEINAVQIDGGELSLPGFTLVDEGIAPQEGVWRNFDDDGRPADIMLKVEIDAGALGVTMG
jgi:hypothetical protein